MTAATEDHRSVTESLVETLKPLSQVMNEIDESVTSGSKPDPAAIMVALEKDAGDEAEHGVVETAATMGSEVADKAEREYEAGANRRHVATSPKANEETLHNQGRVWLRTS